MLRNSNFNMAHYVVHTTYYTRSLLLNSLSALILNQNMPLVNLFTKLCYCGFMFVFNFIQTNSFCCQCFSILSGYLPQIYLHNFLLRYREKWLSLNMYKQIIYMKILLQLKLDIQIITFCLYQTYILKNLTLFTSIKIIRN